MFFPITVSVDFDNGGMMDNSVDGSYRHHGIREDLVPMAKGLVWGNDQTATFISMGDKFKQDLGFRGSLFDIADVIDDSHLNLGRPFRQSLRFQPK